jgi:hypothetical protein
VWFAGVHGDAGGGYPEHVLSDIALRWMVDRARSCGLAFGNGAFDPLGARDAMGQAHESRTKFYKLLPPFIRPIGVKDAPHESAASSALERLKDHDSAYSPRGLVTYLNGPHRETQV